ncbi:MAG: transketolase [Oscillospiraceae bacterium]
MTSDTQISNSMLEFSKEIRITTLNALALTGYGHVGGCMSVADVLAVLYGGVMRINPSDPTWSERDWLVMSKGHCGMALYATLALKGFFPMEWLSTINKLGTRLPSHCDRRKTPGIDMTTGSLGQGLSAAVGIALAKKCQGAENYIYCILGDGEMQEGQVWEAIQTAAHYSLSHCIAFVDDNKKQLDDRLDVICRAYDFCEKFQAFGWHAQRVNGANVQEIYQAIINAKRVEDRPSAIILDTVKGIGCNFAETTDFNHYITVTREMADSAIAEINARYEKGVYPEGVIYE